MHGVAASLNIPVLADLIQNLIHCSLEGKSKNEKDGEKQCELLSRNAKEGASHVNSEKSPGETDSLSSQLKQESIEVIPKKKRGRPRKYLPSGESPTPVQRTSPKKTEITQNSANDTQDRMFKRKLSNLSPSVSSSTNDEHVTLPDTGTISLPKQSRKTETPKQKKITPGSTKRLGKNKDTEQKDPGYF
jgi:hypothetical protein